MFKSALVLRSNRGENNYTLTKPLVYYYPALDEYFIAPSGMTTDFASVPRFVKKFIDDNDSEIRDAAVIHDYLYSSDCFESWVTRKHADQILRYAMGELGASWVKRNAVYLAVRVFGRRFFRR